MTLLLNQIFTDSASGIVELDVPTVDNGIRNIVGILASEPSIQVQTEWGNILPQTEDLNEIMQIFGSRNLFSWVSASSASWKSTSPMSVGLDFYLLSYNKQANIKAQLGDLMALSALSVPQDGFLNDALVQVHGGYRVTLTDSNKTLDMSGISDYLANAVGNLSQDKHEGTVSVRINGSMPIDNLLLQDCKAEISTVQVEDGVPLFIKVTTVFRMYRAPLISDIRRTFR